MAKCVRYAVTGTFLGKRQSSRHTIDIFKNKRDALNFKKQIEIKREDVENGFDIRMNKPSHNLRIKKFKPLICD